MPGRQTRWVGDLLYVALELNFSVPPIYWGIYQHNNKTEILRYADLRTLGRLHRNRMTGSDHFVFAVEIDQSGLVIF